MNTQHLIFMKQLLDNVDYANENGVLNVVKLFKHTDSDVTEGTNFALGAFDTLQKLIDLRPDLFTTKVIQELKSLSQDNDERVRSVAQAALERLY